MHELLMDCSAEGNIEVIDLWEECCTSCLSSRFLECYLETRAFQGARTL
jgi:hypothetical protein